MGSLAIAPSSSVRSAPAWRAIPGKRRRQGKPSDRTARPIRAARRRPGRAPRCSATRWTRPFNEIRATTNGGFVLGAARFQERGLGNRGPCRSTTDGPKANSTAGHVSVAPHVSGAAPCATGPLLAAWKYSDASCESVGLMRSQSTGTRRNGSGGDGVLISRYSLIRFRGHRTLRPLWFGAAGVASLTE